MRISIRIPSTLSRLQLFRFIVSAFQPNTAGSMSIMDATEGFDRSSFAENARPCSPSAQVGQFEAIEEESDCPGSQAGAHFPATLHGLYLLKTPSTPKTQAVLPRQVISLLRPENSLLP
jgi:hypothetical protein